MKAYETEIEILDVVRGFESCETDKGAFRHRDHLTVAVYYLQVLSFADAASRIKTSLLHFLDHHGVDRQKYNETLTIFWLETVADVLKDLPDETSLVSRCNTVLGSLSNSNLALEYYSEDLLFSDLARVEFVKPDLKKVVN